MFCGTPRRTAEPAVRRAAMGDKQHFSGFSSGCEDDYSADDQSDDNFNGGGAAVAGAQPVLAVEDIVQDEPAGRERHRHRGVSPVAGAVQEICAHGAVLHMLHVRGADGMDVDIGLAPIAKDTLYVPPLAATLAGRCFLNPSSASNAVTWCPSFCEAPFKPYPAKVLAVDTEGLNAEYEADGITHYGGQVEFVNGIPVAPVPLPVFGAGAYRSPLLEPGEGCFQHAWVIAEPRLWQLGDPPVHMNVIRGHLAIRELREVGEPLVGLAHLWLRHLPVSFVYQMACLNMEWRDARDALLDRRGGLELLRDAFDAGGDEALAEARLEIYPHLDSGPPPPSDLWGVEEDLDDPDVLAVERMRRPAAELGPNWLEIVTGRAHTDEEVVGAAQEEGEVPHVWREPRAVRGGW